MIAALMAGMLSENWSAERSRTGPRSSLSAWVGMKPPPKFGRDVHEHRGGRQRAVVDADRVVDRLDRRPGLAPAVGHDVELGLELLVALRRVAGAADVGEDLAGPVVDDAGRGVVDVVPAQAQDPVPSRWSGSCALAGPPRVVGVRRPRRRVDPLLGGLLHRPVERRGHLVAAGVHLRAVGRGVRAQDLGQLRRGPATRSAAPSSSPTPAGSRTTGSCLAASYSAAVCLVPVSGLCVFMRSSMWLRRMHDLGRRRDDEVERRCTRSSSATSSRADLVGVLHEVELGRRLRDGGEDRELGERQLARAPCRSSPWPPPSRRSCCCRRSSGSGRR